MGQLNLVYVYILAFALLFAGLWWIISRDRQRFFRVLFLYFTGTYFLLSAVKLVLGSAPNTLAESFWDSDNRTYIHYAEPVLLVCILVFIVLIKAKCLRERYVIEVFCGSLFTGGEALILVNGRISNAAYCLLFTACAVLSAAAGIFRIAEPVYYQKDEYKKASLEILSYIGAWIVMHCIFLPNELYLGNPGEFTGAYGSFFVIMICGGVLTTLLITAGELLFLPRRAIHYVNVGIMAITILGYIQNMFLNGRMEILDGDEQIWPVPVQFGNLAVWAAGIALIVLLCVKKKIFVKVCRGICIYILLIQTVTLGYLVATTDLGGYRQQGELTIENSLEIGSGQNVFVFVLDRLDSSWMETLYGQDPDFCSPLSDFTFYPDATSPFANTGPGIPFLLTASPWRESYGTAYNTHAYENSSFLPDLKENGFDIGIYTNVGHVSERLYSLISNYKSAVKKKYDAAAAMVTMWKCSMYKTAPFIVKNHFSYYSDAIRDIVKAPEVWDTENDYWFWQHLKKEKLSIAGDCEKAFRFYHMHGAHDPYTLSEDMKYDRTGREGGLYSQIRGSLKIVYEYMEQLKALGKYDDAVIVITADHGQQTDFIKETGKPQRVSLPAIMIKKPYAEQERMTVNQVPVSHAELMSSLVKLAGMDNTKYGKGLDEASDNGHERIFLKLYPEFVKYTIKGDARNIDNWRGEQLQEN